jgi:DNA-binding transcriptional MocR family regulator
MLASLQKHCVKNYQLTIPQGGYFLWLQLEEGLNTLEVHRMALEASISVAPGPMFSARREFRNCLRLNYGHPWTVQMDRAIAEICRIIRLQ